MRKTNEKNNKGFSLVELIVVIAIMIVLVAVLAPVFTKYVEQSRRATDVTNANAIAEAVLVDAADGTLKADAAAVDGADDLASIKSVPKTKGNAVKKGDTFSYEYNKDSNTVVVYVTSDSTAKTDLTNEDGASAYKNDTTADNSQVDAPAE